MSESRPGVKLDFTTGLEAAPKRPKPDDSTTLASVVAGRELGFSAREPLPPAVTERASASPLPLDGRRLRSRGANIQFNLKVTQAEKDMILLEASRHIQDPLSAVSNIGEFVVLAVEYYKEHHH
jgi:hypothetical protein